MKCFLVYVSDWDYDTYDGVVVTADSEEEVRNMLHYDGDLCRTFIGDDKYAPYFKDSQGEVFIVEIKEKGIVLASFNAG